jgi:hypothetical protein
VSGLAAVADGEGDEFEALLDGVGYLPPAVAVGADEVVALLAGLDSFVGDLFNVLVDVDEPFAEFVGPVLDVPLVHVAQGSGSR